ncbi:hypothetical protein FOL47_010751 [Perkinsus chesapeaki]|uniref:ceramidase n=1 Tax=Perkinsus chesapeaki TaxID=330153 RepID=A0A7J6L305_PERCH|nr:hypothetical protein FOL47_010751 [Perkinsus chesapeaki]
MLLPVLLSFTKILSVGSIEPAEPAPRVVVDLSKRPSLRFKSAVDISLKTWQFNESFEPLFAQWNKTTFDQLTDDDYETFMSSLERYFPVQALELRGISDEFARHGHYVSYAYLAAWAYSHEIGHFREDPKVHHDCSALLVADKNGHVVHGRNMDQGAPDYARRVTLQLKYVNGGSVMSDVEALDFYWFAGGMVTAVTPDGLSMQENWRSVNKPKSEIMQRIRDGAVPHKYMFREMIFNNRVTDFDHAVDFLKKIPFGASVYIAVAGRGEFQGAILTRNETDVVVPVEDLKKSWYAVETNHDNWFPDPPSDPRRTKAEECIEGHGQKDGQVATFGVVMDCISSKPVLNKGTIYTAIMSPRNGELWGRIRYDAAQQPADPEEFTMKDILV